MSFNSEENNAIARESKILFQVTDLLKFVVYFLILIPITLYSWILTWFMMPKSLRGKICLVTGAGQGLGRELSLQLSVQGAIVVCVDIRKDGNQETVEMIKSAAGEAYGYTCNIANYDEVMQLAKTVQAEVGRVYLLINNAGLIMTHNIFEWTKEDINSIYNVNVFSHYWTMQAFYPSMKEANEGHFVNIMSILAHHPVQGLSVYGPSKAAGRNLVETIRMELAVLHKNNNIVVTGVYPTVINTSKDIGKFYSRGNIGLLSVGSATRTIIEGIKYNKESIFVPGFIYYFGVIVKCLPQIFYIKAMEMLDTTIHVPSQEEKKNTTFAAISNQI